MPRQTPSAERLSAAIHTLSIPSSGMERIALIKDWNLEFTFEPGSVSFSRSGTDLVVSAGNGAGLTLQDFFAADHADSLPRFILPGGGTVPSAGYLQSLKVDVATEAGPAAEARPPFRKAQYAEGAGDLLDGAGRPSPPAAGRWDGAVKTVDVHADADRGAVAGGPVVSSVPPAPDIVRFNARAVLHMRNEGDAPNGRPYDPRGVTVQALAGNGNGEWEASGEKAAGVAFIHSNFLPLAIFIEYEQDAEGNITFRLTEAGRDRMAAHGKDMVAYYAITDAAGNTYTLQVVISADGASESSSEHNGGLDPGGLIHCEWHGGKDPSLETDSKATSSALSDDLRYTGGLTGAEINVGRAGDKNRGNDPAANTGEVRRSFIASGAGDDMITITGGGDYNRLIGGGYAGGMFTAGMRGKEEAGGATAWGGAVDAGDGNTIITIAGDHPFNPWSRSGVRAEEH